ncbi:uncharacterized protein LOC114937575 [Nylanderia fulva]|uniref:uncharacterized protein LOC114931580 n=1 Tax=Nylanderia fulva TaxID=613905 RepID=UPI0010FB9DBC|nr:uncharacterized protein LOC114931580 [Nylanderia fulva]XP_029166923.1 uncharacterized protein LOC114937575 [Nylanderia fulva]
MADTTTIITNATALYGKISRAYDNLRKLGEANITLGAVEARLLNLDKLWEKFDAMNDILAERVDELKHDAYAKQDIPSLGEESYLVNKGLMLELRRTLQKKERAAASATSETSTSAPRTTLPRIQLPTFTGRYEDWPAFRDLFVSLIGQDKTTKPVEKMHYLKSCVKGKADLLIRDLSSTEANYERAWQTLSDYYENKRLLTRSYLTNFLSLPKMKGESAAELRKIFHGIKTTVSSLTSIDRPVGITEDLFVHLAVDLLDSRSRREWETSISETNEPPPYALLERFLERRLHTLESLPSTKIDVSPNKTGGSQSKSTRTHHARKQDSKEPKGNTRGRCSACQGDHFVMLCDTYKKMTASERKQHVEGNDLCGNCLGRHKIKDCASKKNCSACNDRHHTSLHDAYRSSETVKTSHVSKGPFPTPVSVLLATARVRVCDRYGFWQSVRALVDQVYGVGGKKTGVSKGKVVLTLQSLSGCPSITVHALVLPKLTIYAGGYNGGEQNWSHLQGLELADPDYRSADPVDILLGADVYGSILCQGLKKGNRHEPIAQQTTLGWILSGVVGETTTGHHVHTHQCQIEDDVSILVRRFWEQEELQRPSQLFSKADQECEDHFLRHHTRTANGRYVVRLPTIEPLPDLSATRRAASRALQHVSKKLERESTFRSMYVDFMKQYLDLNHMKPAPLSTTGSLQRTCYLPHHGVLSESSASTKLRVVFNGSSSLANGDCLNRFLMTGPNLLPALADILLRRRRHRV